MTSTSGTKWEADQMLNAYILDYLKKKNFTQTASAFEKEAKVPTEPVLINAPDGFVLEWWSVFWDIFSARTKKPASENAKAYVEKQKDRGSYSLRRPSQVGMPPGARSALMMTQGVSNPNSQHSPLQPPPGQNPGSSQGVPIPPYSIQSQFSSQYSLLSGGPSNLPSPPAISVPRDGIPPTSNGNNPQQQSQQQQSYSQASGSNPSSQHSGVSGQNPQSGSSNPQGQGNGPVQPVPPASYNGFAVAPSTVRRGSAPMGYPNQVSGNNGVPPHYERGDYSNLRISRGQAISSGSNPTPPTSNSPAQRSALFDNPQSQQPSSQSQQPQAVSNPGISPRSSAASSPNGTVPSDTFYADRRRNFPNSSAYPMHSSGGYSYMKSQSPGISQQKEISSESSGNGSVPVGATNASSMNNPIPNPTMTSAMNNPNSNPSNTNSSGSTPPVNRKNSFENADSGMADSGELARNDPMHYMGGAMSADKRKRLRQPTSGKAPSGQPPPQNGLPAEYVNPQRINARPPPQRRKLPPNSFPSMQGGASGYPSTSPQGTGQGQSTPDNHPSPSVPSSPSSEPQQDSPSASYSKANNVLPPYFSGSQQYNSSQYSQNPSYASGSYGTAPSPSGQSQYNTGQNPSPGYSYTGQQQPQSSQQQPANYNGQSVPAGYTSGGPVPSSYTSAYGNGVKMNHSGNFSLSGSMGSQQKSMHVHPHIGRSNSGMVAKKQAFLKQSINMGNHDQAEDSEACNNVPSDKESGFQSLGIDTNNMLSSDPMYRNMSESDNIYGFGNDLDAPDASILLQYSPSH